MGEKRAVANVEIRRVNDLWMVCSHDLPGVHCAGHSFQKALERYAAGAGELFAITMDDAERVKQTVAGKV